MRDSEAGGDVDVDVNGDGDGDDDEDDDDDGGVWGWVGADEGAASGWAEEGGGAWVVGRTPREGGRSVGEGTWRDGRVERAG